MSSDASDDIIPDSQESANEDNEPILTIPSVINTPSVAPSNGVILDNNNEIHSNDNLENTTYVQSNATKSLDASTINISGRSAITPDKHLSENLYAPQRSLRKRTAIQRMPYSLERIKHRQLLEGYDVSSFDTVSNQVDISALEKRNENVINTSLMRDINQVRDNMVNHEDELFEYNMGIVSDDSDLSFEEDDYDISIRDQNTQSNSDVSLLTSSIVPAINDAKYNEEDDILFRGKRLKVKTGYRGILPKMVWEKQLSSVGTKSKTLKRKSRHHGGKGVAVKKKTKTTTGQDNSLLNELISDGYASEDSDDFEIYHQVQNLEAQETPALVELDMYYHNKYDNNYLSDTSLTDEFDGNILTKSPNLEFTRETFFTDMDHGQVPLIHDGNLNNDVLEDNRSAFNPLLSSRKDQSPPRAKQLKENSGIVTRKPLSKRKNIIRRVSIKKYRHPRIRTSHEKSTPINLQPMYPGNHLSVQNNEGAEEEEERGDKKEKKVRKTNHYGSNRNTTTYNTVVEALSGKFGSTSHKNSGITKDHEISNDIIIIPELPSLEILDVFFKKTNLTPPKTVSISLNNVTYVLSRFNTNEIEASFFSILSLCYDKLIIANTEILNQSYDIMATIVDELKKKDALWTIFNEKKFIPDVVRLLCNIFPTKKPQWNVIKIEATFSGANLFPLLKHKAEISIDYVNYYCEVGDYLIKSGELNWWQFITFNGLEHNENIRFYFISKVIELCDVASFKNIEKDFYRLIVNNIETSYDNDHFWNLCKVLLFKADNTSSTFDITTKKNMLSYFPFWKKVFKVLGDLNFKGLVRALMEKVANLYATEKIERTCTERIITYLDGKYFQDLQDIKTFNHLRAVFNISNKDMENNEFKKSLSELPNITEQVLHIEQAVLLADYDDVIEEKVLSLFSSTGSFHLNPYRIIITAIMANGRKETRSLDVFIKRMKMANFLLSTMLKANLEKFYQLKKNEYLESIQLVRFICLFHRFDNVASMQSKIYSRFMTTSATFILQMSSISMGFDESYIIGTYMENNWFPSDLKNHTARVDPPPKELIDKIEKMLEEDSSSVADDSYSNSPKENNKFADFIALLKDNL
ncbi:hypothetical protein C6P44_004973 [Monosporozyma unispora]|nr:hypothetical protein C6P44_004973 [Kazachstania unispora]